jgi:methyl-accepting chemotaxis protein
MTSISIKTGLTSLFAVLILLIAGLGYLAVTRIADINHNVEDFSQNYLPSVAALGDLNDHINTFRYLEAEHVFSRSPGEMEGKDRDLAKAEDQVRNSLNAYAQLADSPDEKVDLAKFNSKWQEYQANHRKLLEFSRANTNTSHVEAGTLWTTVMGGQFDELSDIIDHMVQINKDRSQAATKRSADEYASTRFQALLFVGIALAVALGALIFSFAVITRPIERITQAMGTLAKGDVSAEIPFKENTNEIGAMAGAVQVFKDNMIRSRELESEAAAASTRAQGERKRAMSEMAEQFERTVGGIVRSVSDAAAELQSAAQALSSSSSQTTNQSTAVAAASEEAAANVRTVAAAAEELSGSVREITRQVSESSNMAQKAVQEAEQTNAQVSGLSVGAQKIGAIVDLINDIASKTNLLALNATIEAARAGEAGRGFAVVASEVKALAEQTSKATAEITSHIGAVQGATDQAANAILGIGRTIGEINHIAATIAAAVEEQGAATEEIARNVDQAARGTSDVTQNISGVSHAAEASSASANQVLTSATELAAQSEKLRGEMQKFLANVRAA